MPDCPPARLSVGVCSPTFPSVRPSGLPAPAFPPDHRRRSRPPAWPARLLNSTDQLPNCPPGCLGSSPAAMTPVSVGSRCCRFELAWYVRVLPPHTVHVLCELEPSCRAVPPPMAKPVHSWRRRQTRAIYFACASGRPPGCTCNFSICPRPSAHNGAASPAGWSTCTYNIL